MMGWGWNGWGFGLDGAFNDSVLGRHYLAHYLRNNAVDAA